MTLRSIIKKSFYFGFFHKKVKHLVINNRKRDIIQFCQVKFLFFLVVVFFVITWQIFRCYIARAHFVDRNIISYTQIYHINLDKHFAQYALVLLFVFHRANKFIQILQNEKKTAVWISLVHNFLCYNIYWSFKHITFTYLPSILDKTIYSYCVNQQQQNKQ